MCVGEELGFVVAKVVWEGVANIQTNFVVKKALSNKMRVVINKWFVNWVHCR